MKTILQLTNVCKVFGEKPSEALQLLDQGENKESIFEKTGQTLGVVNASFDVYEGESIGLDKKSIAINLSFQHAERTLEELEVTDFVDKIMLILEQNFDAKLRV